MEDIENNAMHGQAISSSRSFRTKIVVVLTLVCLFASGAIFVRNYFLPKKPLSSTTLKNINFVPYYPKILPTNYSKVEGSEKIVDGILFFDLSDGNTTINISQQKLPLTPPNLDGLLEFKKLQTISGKAAVGTQKFRAVGVLLTTTTLISVTGSEGVPEDVIGSVIQSLQYIP